MEPTLRAERERALIDLGPSASRKTTDFPVDRISVGVGADDFTRRCGYRGPTTSAD